MDTPHRVVDSIANGIVGGFTGLLHSGANAIKDAGRNITRALDTPVEDITGKEGPIKMVDDVAEGFIDAGVNFVDKGVVGTAQTAKEGVMKALDQPTKQIGFPPKLGVLEIFKKK
jgi:hypothetical protein